jgi:hypothetical protein
MSKPFYLNYVSTREYETYPPEKIYYLKTTCEPGKVYTFFLNLKEDCYFEFGLLNNMGKEEILPLDPETSYTHLLNSARCPAFLKNLGSARQPPLLESVGITCKREEDLYKDVQKQKECPDDMKKKYFTVEITRGAGKDKTTFHHDQQSKFDVSGNGSGSASSKLVCSEYDPTVFYSNSLTMIRVVFNFDIAYQV